jgi:hypothetical protein
MRIAISDSNNVFCPAENKPIDMGYCYGCICYKSVDMKGNCIECCFKFKDTKILIEGKPPLGLKPRFIVEQERIGEIRMAMNRYIDEFKAIPLDWIFEYNDLASRQKK